MNTSLAILPHSGELIDLDNPNECARALESIRTVEAQLREIKQDLTRAVANECARQGADAAKSQATLAAPAAARVWDDVGATLSLVRS